MKKVLSIILAAVTVLSLSLFAGCGKSNTEVKNLEGTYTKDFAGTTLNVFNWGEYISDGSEGSLDVVAAFEKVTGIKVNYVTYESNEAMYAKIKSGAVAYDVIIPSDYMIERMKNEGLLQKIDLTKISNYKYIDDQYKGLYFDENEEYTVPYNVGMVGLIYNSKMVSGDPDSWSIMWDEKYKGNILSFNNSRDAFAIAQFLLGIDINTTDKSDWDKAAEKLTEQNSVLQGRVMDEVFSKMEGGNAAIATYYAGDYLTMAENNPDLKFVYPKEGTNIFIDSMCIPSSAKNTEAAHMFINFMLDPEVALANAEYLCYATPNTSVRNNPEYSLKDNKILYPDNMDSIKTEYFHDLDSDTRSYYESLWDRVIIN